MAEKEFTEIRKAAKAREEERIKKAQESRRKEAGKDREPKVVFTKQPGTELTMLPEDSEAAQAARAFRDLQMGITENTPEEIVKVGLPHPESQTAHQSQEESEPTTELVFTDDTEALPKGASGAKIADGVFEIVKSTISTGGESDGKSVPVHPKAKAAIDTSGSHPVRLEDDTRTNQS